MGIFAVVLSVVYVFVFCLCVHVKISYTFIVLVVHCTINSVRVTNTISTIKMIVIIIIIIVTTTIKKEQKRNAPCATQNTCYA